VERGCFGCGVVVGLRTFNSRQSFFFLYAILQLLQFWFQCLQSRDKTACVWLFGAAGADYAGAGAEAAGAAGRGHTSG